MKRLPGAILVFAALLLSAAAQTPVPETGSIEGVVIDDEGKPISGVTVWGPPKNPEDLPIRAERQSTTTAADGRFLLQQLEPGRLDIAFFKPGYSDRLVKFSVAVAQRVANATVRLSSTGVIAGQVLDSSGRPLVRARAQAFAPQGKDGRWTFVTTLTNDRGEFRITNLPPNRYRVGFEALAPLRSPGQPALPPPAGDLLALRWDSPDPYATGMRPILYPGVASLSKADSIEVKGGEVVDLKPVSLTSAGLGVVRVRLSNTPGEPAKNVELRISDINWKIGGLGTAGSSLGLGGSTSPAKTRLNAGESVLQTYWPTLIGLFEVRAAWTDAAGTKAEQSVRLQFNGDDTEVELVIGKPQGRLDIRAIRQELDGSETPVAGASVGACRVGAYCVGWKLDKEGRASVTGAVASIYSLDMVAPIALTSYIASAQQGSRNVLTDGIRVTPDSEPLEIRIKLTAGAFQGRVTDARGFPVHDALVALVSDPPIENRGVRASVRTDQQGRFEVTRVGPGKYRAFASTKKDAIFGDSFILDDPAFVAQFWDGATPVQIEDSGKVSVDLVIPGER
jgi:hypothetical protein